LAVYNKAYELSKMISDSEEYKEYASARADIEKDANAMWVLKDFRKRQMQLEIAQMSGQKPSPEDIKKYQELASAISMHAPITRFLGVEMRLMQMMGDIQRILGENLKLWDYMSPDEPEQEKKE
jgi:cell fate (sporulation/competence/biofilm development) regulator YlbF (YheA/YmcA/DUF963 family)